MNRLHLMLAIQRARAEGYTHLAAALCEMLRKEIKPTKTTTSAPCSPTWSIVV